MPSGLVCLASSSGRSLYSITCSTPSPMTKLPTFSSGAGLGDRLAAHLAAGEVVQAEEQRVDAVDERVVDLEVGEVLDAALAHVGQRAAALEGAERSAVAVGAEGERILLAPAAVCPSMSNAGIMPCWKKKTSAGS